MSMIEPTWAMASRNWRRASSPLIVIRPAVGRMRPTIIRIVVVFPAPFGPRNPKISPS